MPSAALTPAFRTWEAFNIPVPGLGGLHFNSTFVIGAVLMLIMFAIQHRGIASTASAQKVLAIIVLVPLLLVGLVPILTGAIDSANVTGLVPPTAGYSGVDGTWSLAAGRCSSAASISRPGRPTASKRPSATPAN